MYNPNSSHRSSYDNNNNPNTGYPYSSSNTSSHNMYGGNTSTSHHNPYSSKMGSNDAYGMKSGGGGNMNSNYNSGYNIGGTSTNNGGNMSSGSQQTSVALFNIPSEAKNSIYVDGVPNDATEREVNHVFRPYPGFQQIRLIRKSTSTGREYLLCFVDFENVLQSTIALNTLQGYRFDKHDKIGLKISYANESREESTRNHK